VNPLYLADTAPLTGIDYSLHRIELWLPRLHGRDAVTAAFVESLQLKDRLLAAVCAQGGWYISLVFSSDKHNNI